MAIRKIYSNSMFGLVLTGCLSLAFLAAAELLLRVPAVYETLPLPRIYYTHGVSRRLQYLEKLQQGQRDIDVLFIGSSTVRSNISPTRFDRAFARAASRDVLSFNGGMSKMFPTGAVVYAEHVWLRKTRPRLMLHGVRESELTDKLVRPRYLDNGRVEPMWIDREGADVQLGHLLQEFRLLQYRGVLKKIIERTAKAKPWNIVEPTEAITNERGYGGLNRRLSNRKGRGKRFWTYKGKLRKNRYRHAHAAMRKIHRLSREAGVQYAIFHLPEHPKRFKTKGGRRTWKAYQEKTRSFCAHEGIPFFDVTDGEFRNFGLDEYFSDYHHMRMKGAAEMSRLLARQVAKRWNGKLPPELPQDQSLPL